MKNKICIKIIVLGIGIATLVSGQDNNVSSNINNGVVMDINKLPKLPAADNEAFFGSRIQRTMTLLHTSNPKHRNPVKILFYGQSIVASPWSGILASQLKSRFPDADLITENHAIGGYTAPSLIYPSIHDLYPVYPDLVVFHVYGGAYSGELESIISNIRRNTTAEIMLFTHHIRPKPNHMKSDDLDNNAIIELAQKYNCELVELRKEWRNYIETYNLDPDQFLADGTHPNAKGNKLMADIVGRHFKFNPLMPNNWSALVRTYQAKRFYYMGVSDEISFTGKPWKSARGCVVGTSPDSKMKLTFTGNRIDVIAGKSKNKLGSATILIDGKAPSTYPNTCVFTRPSKAFGSWMPAIRRVTHNIPLIPEDWSLIVTKNNEKGSRYSFEVTGSVTGPDGVGSNTAPFVSDSGRVVIKNSDLTMYQIACQFKKPYPDKFEVNWKAIPLCVDVYHPPVIKDDAKVYQTTLAQGLENRTHTIEIIPNGDGDVPIKELQVYRPPLD